jgi:uncharacterized protein (DUF885 family)
MRIAVLSLALIAPALAPAQTDALHKLFSDAFEQRLRDNPEFATSIGRDQYNDRWTDWSAAAVARRYASEEDYLKRLAAISLDGVSAQDRLSAQLFRYIYEQRLASETLDVYLLRVNQLFGLHNQIYQTIDRMPARTVHDYENLIARLRAVPAYVDENIALLDHGIAQGIVQPRLVARLVSGQIAAQAAETASDTPLLTAFRRFPSNISEAERGRLLTEGTAAYERGFLPAWRKLHDYMAGTYTSKARDTIAISALPNGKQDYRILVRVATTTDMTPEEIHRLGLSEVSRIEKEMLVVARQTGFRGTLAEFERKLANSPEQHFRTKEEMLVWCRNIAKIIEPQLPNLFENIPAFLYGVRAIPPDREAATATHAEFPKPGNTAPGWFDLNCYRPEKQPRYDKEALVLHEAVPGHIMQGAISQSLSGLPDFRRFYFNSAFGEGWALYAESLGGQLGVYLTPYTRFGKLASERFRAVRLVVDTGIHALGWSRAQALDYFRQHVPEESAAEIDRYIAWPGQALSYKIGELNIEQLRQAAEKELGSKFDIRVFHDAVLRNGALPLALLDSEVRESLALAR